ncbi:hypothetical protein ABPG72_015225 [Tetrahymena utriculariae]
MVYENQDLQDKLFTACLQQLEKEYEPLNQLTYINQQTKNYENTQKLFDLNTRKRIIYLLKKESFDSEIKYLCTEVINNYLYHPSNELSGEELEIQAEIILKYRLDQDLVEEVLKSILICSQKRQNLPQSVVSGLIKCYHKFNGQIQNQIIFIFGFICNNQNIQNIDIFHLKLREEKVAIFEEDNLVFEERTQENLNYPTISEQVAKLFYYSAFYQNKLNENSIKSLFTALQSTDDVQIKIQCSKAIYMASKYQKFENHFLDNLFTLIDDEIIDISIYTSAALVQQLHDHAKQKKTIKQSFFNCLSKIYLFEKMELYDFTNEINESIIKVLQYVATQQNFDKFDDSIFEIFEHILNSNSEFMLKEVVDILLNLTQQKILLPQTSIKALENALVFDQVQDKVFKSLVYAIENSQPVGEKVLEDISNSLLYSLEPNVRENSFKILDKANDNQDLPLKIFNLVELQRAGMVISGKIKDSCEQAKIFIEKLSNQGQTLPIDTLEALQENLKDQKVLNILENNYEIPYILLKKLEICLKKSLYSQQSLSIFNLIAQRGEKISESTICCLCEFFIENNQIELRQQAFQTIRILMESKNYKQQLFKEAFIRAADDDDNFIFEITIYLFEFIKSHLNNLELRSCLKNFANKIFKNKLSNSAQQKANFILNFSQSNLENETQKQLQLCNLFQQQQLELYLEQIEKMSKNYQILSQNFFQLSEIINSSRSLQKRVVQFLTSLQNKKDIPEYLVDQIAKLYENTISNDLQKCCFLFLKSIVANDRVLSEKAVKSVENFGNFNQLQCLIGQKMPQKGISDKFKLLLKIQDAQFTNNEANLFQLFSEIQDGIDADEVLNTLSDQIIHSSKEQEITYLSLQCIALAVQIEGKLNEKSIIVLEKIFKSDNNQIKYYSFKALREVQQAGLQCKEFSDWCSATLKLITNQTGIQLFQQLDLLEIISSFRYFDVSILNKENIKDWEIKLILNNIQNLYGISNQEMTDLEQSLQSLEQQENYQKKGNLKKLLTALNIKLELITFEQLKDLIIIFYELDFESTLKIIQESTNFFRCLQKQYVKHQLEKLMIQKYSTKYYEQQASEIFQKVDQSIIYKAFQSLSCIQNDQELEDLLQFLADNPQIQISDIKQNLLSVSKLKQKIEISLLINMISYPESENLFEKLLQNKFSFQQLNQISNILNNTQNINTQKIKKIIIQVLEQIAEYNIPNSQWPFIIQIIQNEIPELWEKKIHQKAVSINFTLLNRKHCDQIIQELSHSNQENQHVESLVESQFFSFLIEKIRDEQLQTQFSDFGSTLKNIPLSNLLLEKYFLSEKPIKEWENCNIKAWAQYVKKTDLSLLNDQFIVEALAVVHRAIYLNNNHFQLSYTQIISCILFLKSRSNQGRILQIATGEGKSIIICVVAIILALFNKKVDIITSSQVLAERDAKDKKRLYSVFDISVGCNCDNSYKHGIKECYKKDIVYGSIDQFKFDYLRDKYSNYGTLGSRKQVIPIIDEADFILIDECIKIARLTSNFPGMDLLQHFIYYLNKRYLHLKESRVSVRGQIYFLNYELICQKLQDLHQDCQINNEIINNYIQGYIDNPQKNMEEISRLCNDEESYIKQDLKKYIEELVSQKELLLPKALEQFVQSQLPKWIDCLIIEQFYEVDVDFVMPKGTLKPVDFNTGIVQDQTSFCDGLQQIKQIQNNLEVSSETLTTNYISNYSYIQTYENNIIGLTGTLGSDNSRDFLRELYNVDLVNVPNSYHKQYIQFQDKLANDFASWIQEISNEAEREARKNRGVLVICENIKFSNLIYDVLKKIYEPFKLILYNQNLMEQEKSIQEIQEGYVIISTNLSARGTDIKTNDQIEKNGGLHVILTYKPANQRLEDQGLGRTARFGKKGTARLIINKEIFEQYGVINSIKIQKIVYELEEIELNKIKQQIQDIKIKDELFFKQCQLQDKLRQSLCKKIIIQQIFQQYQYLPTLYESCVISSLEEKWEIFLRKIEDRKIDSNNILNEYENFKNNQEILINQKQFTQMIKNPFYKIQIGNDMLVNNTNQINQQHDAMFFYDEALRLDNNLCHAAFVGKALLTLKRNQDQLKDKDIKQNAIYFLQASLKGLADEINLLNEKHSYEECEEDEITQLKQQDTQKIQILTQLANNIEEGLKVIIRSQRLIDITSEKQIQNSFVKDLFSKQIIQREICQQYGIQKDYDSLKINEVISKYDSFNVTFHDLIAYENFTTQDQAINLISDFTKYVNLNQCIINVNLKNINSQMLQSLISPDLEILQVNRQQALDTIKSSKYDKNKKIDVTLNHLQSQIVKPGLSFSEAEMIINKQEMLPFINGEIPILLQILEMLVKYSKKCSHFFIPYIIKLVDDLISIIYQIVKLFVNKDSIDTLKFIFDTIDRILSFVNDHLYKVKQFADLFAFDEKYQEQYKSLYSQLFDLKLLSANKKYFELEKKILCQSKLMIEYKQLNQENCIEIIQNIQAKQYEIQIVGPKSEILNAINYNVTRSFLVKEQKESTRDQDRLQFTLKEYSSDNLMSIINKLSGKNVCVQFVGLTQKDMIELFRINKQDGANNSNSQNQSLFFDLKCINVKPQNISSQTKDYNFNFSFTSMSFDTAKNLIPILRKEKTDFSLTIASINKVEMQQLKDKVRIKQESIQTQEIKPIKEQYLNDQRLNTILQEYQDRGYQYVFKLVEKGFIPLKIIFFIVIVAAIQIFIGIALISYNQSLAASFIIEGLIDLYTAYQVYVYRQFSWKQYLLNKGIGLAIQLITLGKSSINKAAQYLKQAKQPFQKILTKSIVKKGVSLTLNKGAEYFQDYAIQLFEPEISSIIQQKIKERFKDPTLSYLIAKMLALDKIFNQTKNELKIKQIIQKVGSSKSYLQFFNQIGSEICKGVLSDSKILQSKVSIILRLVQILSGLYQLSTIIDNAIAQLQKELIQYDNDFLKIADLLHEIIKGEFQDSLYISEILAEEGIIKTEIVQITNMKIYKIEFDENSKTKLANKLFFDHQQKIVEFLSKFSKFIERQEINSISQQIKFLSDIISNQIISVVKTNIATPLSSYCSGTIQKKINLKLGAQFQEDINFTTCEFRMPVYGENIPIEQFFDSIQPGITFLKEKKNSFVIILGKIDLQEQNNIQNQQKLLNQNLKQVNCQ